MYRKTERLETCPNKYRSGREIQEFIHTNIRNHTLFVTLNTNTPTRPENAWEAMKLWYMALNSKTVGRKFYKSKDNQQWHGFAFLEGNSDISNGPQTIHWHILLSPGPDLPKGKVDKWLEKQPETGEPLVASVMRKRWTTQAIGYGGVLSPKGYAKGSVDVQFIYDSSGVARYVTKRLTLGNPDFERNHDWWTPLPLQSSKSKTM